MVILFCSFEQHLENILYYNKKLFDELGLFGQLAMMSWSQFVKPSKQLDLKWTVWL
jgi:hypothetical protein